MSLEGRLRDLSLTEVLQLLSLGRKSGSLHCHAPLQGRHARLVFSHGAIVDAVVTGSAIGMLDARPNRRAEDTKAVEDAVLDVLLWRDGTFRFAAGEMPATLPGIRLAVEPILIEGAQRAEVWGRIEARVPHARVIPAFVDIEPQQLPLLRLTPPQWEILTGVDGERDLMTLAASMQRELSEVAELVHDLIGAGLLTLREGLAVPRRNPTPPAVPAFIPPPVLAPDHQSAAEASGEDDGLEDSLFDPLTLDIGSAYHVTSHVTVPRHTPPATSAAPVALAPAEPSISRAQDGADISAMDGPMLGRHGDQLARRGDLAGALAYWNAALRAPVPVADAERIREAVALAARLHALLHP